MRSQAPDGSNLRSSVRVQTSAPDESAPAYFAPTLHAFHRDGTVAKSWKLLGLYGEQPFYYPRITVGDFNHDGLTEIAVVNGLTPEAELTGLSTRERSRYLLLEHRSTLPRMTGQ